MLHSHGSQKITVWLYPKLGIQVSTCFVVWGIPFVFLLLFFPFGETLLLPQVCSRSDSSCMGEISFVMMARGRASFSYYRNYILKDLYFYYIFVYSIFICFYPIPSYVNLLCIYVIWQELDDPSFADGYWMSPNNTEQNLTWCEKPLHRW